MRKKSVSSLVENAHGSMNETMLATVSLFEGMEVICRLDERLKERGLTQRELAEMTGLRIGTISELVNGNPSTLNKVQLLAIVVVLRLTSINDFFEVRLPPDVLARFEAESAEWREDRRPPVSFLEDLPAFNKKEESP